MALAATDDFLKRILTIKRANTVKLTPCKYASPDTELMPFQTVGTAYMYLVKRCILGDQTGLGKSPQSINAYIRALEKRPNLKALVVAPKSALYQWQGADGKDGFGKFAVGIKADVVDADVKFKKLGYKTKESYRQGSYEAWAQSGHVMVINYNSLLTDWEKYIQPALNGTPLFIIFDEAAAFKSRKSKIHKIVTKASEYAGPEGWVIAMTATPVMNRLEEIADIYRAILPGLMPNVTNFMDFYCKYITINLPNVPFPVKKVTGYKNLEHFQELIDPFYLGRLKKDVAKQLPTIRTVNIALPLSDAQKKYIKALDEAYRAQQPYEFPTGKESEINGATRITYERMLCNDPRALGYDEESPKLAHLVDQLQTSLEGEKVIVYCFFKSVLDLLESDLKAAKINVVKITGDIGGKEREKARQEFQEGDAQVILLNDAASTALNLQRAGHLIFYDQPWSVGNLAQIIGRMHRIGSEYGQVMVYYYLMAKSVDTMMNELLQKKLSLVETLFGDQGLMLDDQTSIMAELEEMMRVAA